MFSEQHRGPQDAITKSKIHQRLLQLRFHTKIRQVRVYVRIVDADMKNQPHACLFGRVEHDFGVSNRLVMGKEAVVKPDPISVDEAIHSAQGLGQFAGLIEMERVSDHSLPERILAQAEVN